MSASTAATPRATAGWVSTSQRPPKLATSSTVLTLGVIPALYALVKQWQLERTPRNAPGLPADAAQATASIG